MGVPLSDGVAVLVRVLVTESEPLPVIEEDCVGLGVQVLVPLKLCESVGVCVSEGVLVVEEVGDGDGVPESDDDAEGGTRVMRRMRWFCFSL